jgi:hypothetical protein
MFRAGPAIGGDICLLHNGLLFHCSDLPQNGVVTVTQPAAWTKLAETDGMKPPPAGGRWRRRLSIVSSSR